MRRLVLVLAGCSGHATPAPVTIEPARPAPAAGPALVLPADPEVALESTEALQLAQAKGMTASVMTPHPVVCPVVPAPTGDVGKLTAQAPLAGLLVDPAGFLRPDIGVAEAAALLGEPAMCDHEPRSAFMNVFLAPRARGVREAYLETEDGALIGIVVEFDPPIAVDTRELGKRFGAARHMPGPDDAFEAGGNAYAPETADFRGQLMFSHRRRDPDDAWQVHQIILRRTAMVDLLPEAFRSEDDVARLVALALRGRAPEPVGFYGSLGVYDRTIDDRVMLAPARADRNVAIAWIEKQAGRERVHAVHASFRESIASTPQSFARAVARRMHVEPTIAMEGALARIEVAGRGVVRANLTNGISTIVIERTAP